MQTRHPKKAKRGGKRALVFQKMPELWALVLVHGTVVHEASAHVQNRRRKPRCRGVTVNATTCR